jgi:hypothetical protein
MVSDHQNTPHTLTLTLYEYAQSSTFAVFRAVGFMDWLSDIGDVLVWMASALRAPTTRHCKVIPCRPSVNVAQRYPTSRNEATWTVFCSFNEIQEGNFPSNSAGTCWHNLFNDSVIATRYPIPRKPTGIKGLELSLSAMAALTDATRLTNFEQHLSEKLRLYVRPDQSTRENMPVALYVQ